MTKVKQFTDTFQELLIIYITIILLCATAFSFAEGKTFFDSVWWACVTAMTVGYGDIYPITIAGKFIGIFLMHVVPLFVIPLFIATILSSMIDDKNRFTHDEQEKLKKDIEEIKNAIQRI